jgi:spermidine synthase
MGLGGGALAKRFTARGWSVDAVEMDPAVVRMARDYFNVAPSDARIHRMDGRGFLTKDTGMYDLIIMDAPGTGSLPFHLVTREAFAQYRTRLAPGGVLALNVIAVGWRDRLARSLAATLNEAFARVIVLPIAEPPDQLGNLILLASNSELELLEEPPRPWDRFSPEYTRAHAWDNRFEIDPAGEQIITDDLNPVELWAERINLAQRKALHEHFGREGIVW